MDPAIFQPEAPGSLEPIAFEEALPGALPRAVSGFGFVPHPLPPALKKEVLLGRLFDDLDRAKSNLLRLDGLVDNLPGRTSLLAAMRLRDAGAALAVQLLRWVQDETPPEVLELVLAPAASVTRAAAGISTTRGWKWCAGGSSAWKTPATRTLRGHDGSGLNQAASTTGQCSS